MLTRALMLMAGDIAPSRVVFEVAKGPRNGPAREWLASYLQRPLADEISSIDAAFVDIANRPLSPAITVEIVS